MSEEKIFNEALKARLEQFQWREDFGVFVHPEQQELTYSDGDEVEKKIDEILRRVHDRSMFSQDLMKEITDWPTQYHFSPERHNLLRHIQFNKTHKILELGAGCGAITRQLGESGASVTAIEGSLRRARSAALRCQDLPNVKVYASPFQNIDYSDQYDFVTLIGVFEYSAVFFKNTPHPFLSCLKQAKACLKPGGKLILAIENQLRLKYFCGFSEDHTGQPYFGLEDCYTSQTVRTFGRYELKGLLSQAGFSSIEFQYPFPDYKLPRVVFKESAFLLKDFSAEEMIGQYFSRDETGGCSQVKINEILVWPVIARNRQIPDFSNSFLILAGDETSSSLEEEIVLAVGYAANRDRAYNTQTQFLKLAGEKILVRKSRLNRHKEILQRGFLQQTLEDGPYVQGKHLHSQILRSVKTHDFNAFLDQLRLWVHYLMDEGLSHRDGTSIGASLVKKDFIDCIPENLIISERGLMYIDREWIFDKPFTLNSLLLRYFYVHESFFKIFVDEYIEGEDRPLIKILLRLGFPLNEEIFQEYLKMHHEILGEVYPWVGKIDETLYPEKNKGDQSMPPAAPPSFGEKLLVRINLTKHHLKLAGKIFLGRYP